MLGHNFIASFMSMLKQGCYPLDRTVLAIGSTKANVASGAFSYIIDGVQYDKAAVSAGTALSGDNIPLGLYGAWRLEIDADKTITIVEASDNATGYASAVLAMAGLPAVTPDNISMGVVTASLSDGVFDPGTTLLDAAGTTVGYTDGLTFFEALAELAGS